MKTIVTCGDSWMTPVPDPVYKGTHFSEIIASRLNCNLKVFSMMGMSNGGTVVGIDSAINMNPKPSLVLVNSTVPSRIEWPITKESKVDDVTVYNMLYWNTYSISSFDPEFNNNPQFLAYSVKEIVSDQIYHFTNPDPHKQNRLNALTEYVTWLYNDKLKQFTDNYMLYGAFHRLLDSKIPFVVVYDYNNIHSMTSWLEEGKNYAFKTISGFDYQNRKDFKDPGYHTSVACQEKIAELLLNVNLPNLGVY